MAVSSSSTPVCTAEPGLGERYRFASAWFWPLVALALTEVVAVFLLRSTASSMVSTWYGSRTYSYGFVVVPITAILVWRRKAELKRLNPTNSFIGLALLLVFSVTWVVGNVADAQVIQQFAFIGLLDALVWTFLGTQAVRLLRFALLFLFFAVPVGESLVAPLQQFTAAFTVNALRLTGIPAVQDGLILSTPSGDWKIAEACSGIRYLTSSIVVGVLFAGVAFRSWKRRIALIAISAVVPILANAVRAYLIVVLAYLSDNRIAAGVDHIVYGWVFFSLVTAIVISVALGWREPEVPVAELAQTAGDTPLPPVRITRLACYLAISIIILLSVSSTVDFLWSRIPASGTAADLWSAPAGWHHTADADHDWAPQIETIESESAETFTQGPREVDLYIAAYPVKKLGVELISPYNAVAASSEWVMTGTDYRQVTIAGKPVMVREYELARSGQRRVAWMWYLVGDQLTAKSWRIKWSQAESRLLGHPRNVFLFVASARFSTNPARAVDDLNEFLRQLSIPEMVGNGGR